MKVVAEGVETESQRRLLQDLNCEYVQGYLLLKTRSRRNSLPFFYPPKRRSLPSHLHPIRRFQVP